MLSPERSTSRSERQRDAAAAAAVWNRTHAATAAPPPALPLPQRRPATQSLSLPLSRVARPEDSSKSARLATPRHRTLFIWGRSDGNGGLEVRETRPRQRTRPRRTHAHARTLARSLARTHART